MENIETIAVDFFNERDGILVQDITGALYPFCYEGDKKTIYLDKYGTVITFDNGTYEVIESNYRAPYFGLVFKTFYNLSEYGYGALSFLRIME